METNCISTYRQNAIGALTIIALPQLFAKSASEQCPLEVVSIRRLFFWIWTSIMTMYRNKFELQFATHYSPATLHIPCLIVVATCDPCSTVLLTTPRSDLVRKRFSCMSGQRPIVKTRKDQVNWIPILLARSRRLGSKLAHEKLILLLPQTTCWLKIELHCCADDGRVLGDRISRGVGRGGGVGTRFSPTQLTLAFTLSKCRFNTMVHCTNIDARQHFSATEQMPRNPRAKGSWKIGFSLKVFEKAVDDV